MSPRSTSAKSGSVGHQVPNGDVLLAISLESRNERRDAIGESDLSFFEKDHDARGRGDDLCERGKIEDRVQGHCLGGGLQRPMTDRLLVQRAIPTADEDHGTGQLLFSDRLADEGFNRLKLLDLSRCGR